MTTPPTSREATVEVANRLTLAVAGGLTTIAVVLAFAFTPTGMGVVLVGPATLATLLFAADMYRAPRREAVDADDPEAGEPTAATDGGRAGCPYPEDGARCGDRATAELTHGNVTGMFCPEHAQVLAADLKGEVTVENTAQTTEVPA